MIIIALLLLSTIGSSIITAYAADLTSDTTFNNASDPFITDVVLKSSDGSSELGGVGNPGGPPPSAELDKTDQLRIEYSFRILGQSGVVENDTFYLTLPNEIYVPEDPSQPGSGIGVEQVIYDTNNPTEKVFDLIVYTNNTMELIFSEYCETRTAATDPNAFPPGSDFNYSFIGSFWFTSNFAGDDISDENPVDVNMDTGGTTPDEIIQLYFDQPEIDEIAFF